MKKFLFFSFLFFVLIFSFYFFYKSYGFILFVKDHQIIRLVLKKNFFVKAQKELTVEVVNTKESVERGLSFRSELRSESGQKIDALLFIFPKKEIRQFWMKEMLFKIDICWLNDLNLISCVREVAIPVQDREMKIYTSKVKSNLVLETLPNKLTTDDLKLKFFFK